MARAVTIPFESDLLCEGCGYVLNGLPAHAKCPECGKPSDESSPGLRQIPEWERPGGMTPSAFAKATALLLLRPRRFFRTLSPAPSGAASAWFARIHWGLASLLFGIAAWGHWNWFKTLGGLNSRALNLPYSLAIAVAGYGVLYGVTRLAVALTAWEAAYRGLRLPRRIVLRALHYHAAHYLPIALIAAGTVLGYQFALDRDWLSGTTGMIYLYALCAEIVFSAGYLFSTYWTAMRNLMYANRIA